MSVAKRRLSSLLPGIDIFLDVDDLKEIGDLELYVQQSGCILIFLSRGYFYSINCMREAQASTDQKKPVVLLREDDLNKGGITLADSRQECAGKPEVSDYVFTGRPVTVWKRIQEHQIESLRQIATHTLMSTPRFLGPASSSLVLHVPGEVRLQTLRLPAPLTLYVSSANRGARRAAEALSQRVGMEDITITDVRPDSLAGVTMLLYLNKNTWEKADDGSESPLAAQVAKARSEGIPLVIVHEADEDHDGCEFGLFFQTTCARLGRESPSLAALAVPCMRSAVAVPLCARLRNAVSLRSCSYRRPQALIDDGIYKQLAVTWFPPPHREISISVTATILGAKETSTSQRTSGNPRKKFAAVRLRWRSSSRDVDDDHVNYV